MTRKKAPRTALPDTEPATDLLAFTPVPRQRMRRRGWSAARQREFIAQLAQTGSVRAACRALGVGEHQVYVLRNHPEGASFRKAWEAALDMGIQRIEDTAMDRALNGVEAPVFYHGERVGERRVYNDRLLMFLLKNRAPKRFAASSGMKSLDAIGQMELARLKKQWRAEWEAERPNVTAAEVRASIDRKIMDIRRRIERQRPARAAAISDETRAAFAHFIALRDRDLAARGADAHTRAMVEVGINVAADHFDPPAPGSARPAELPSPDAADAGKAIVVKQWQPPQVEPEREPRTTWSLTDESFDP